VSKFISLKEFLEKSGITEQRFIQLAFGYTHTTKRKDKIYECKINPQLKEGKDFKNNYNRTKLIVNKKLLKRFKK
jgi:hypothetical protein